MATFSSQIIKVVRLSRMLDSQHFSVVPSKEGRTDETGSDY